MNELAQALRDLDENKVYELVNTQIEEVPAIEIINACNEGMVAVGELFSEGTYFISELIFSAEILKNIMNQLEPMLEHGEAKGNQGQVVLGTVKGDLHDIGKNIVKTLLRGSGFEVIDLGVDVDTEKFVKAVQESEARVLGLSALLNFTYPAMKDVVDAIAEAGIRNDVNIIIGGAPVNEEVLAYTGADFCANDAVEGVNFCKKVYS